MAPMLIHPRDKELVTELNDRRRRFGAKGHRWLPVVLESLQSRTLDPHALTYIDYGCGRGQLGDALEATGIPREAIQSYDPGIPGLDDPKDLKPADVVMAMDVLEHVAPEQLAHVIAHAGRLARRMLIAVVDLEPSQKLLLDGRNAHLSLLDRIGWLEVMRGSLPSFVVGYPNEMQLKTRRLHFVADRVQR